MNRRILAHHVHRDALGKTYGSIRIDRSRLDRVLPGHLRAPMQAVASGARNVSSQPNASPVHKKIDGENGVVGVFRRGDELHVGKAWE